jgi:hypothetical protein
LPAKQLWPHQQSLFYARSNHRTTLHLTTQGQNRTHCCCTTHHTLSASIISSKYKLYNLRTQVNLVYITCLAVLCPGNKLTTFPGCVAYNYLSRKSPMILLYSFSCSQWIEPPVTPNMLIRDIFLCYHTEVFSDALSGCNRGSSHIIFEKVTIA